VLQDGGVRSQIRTGLRVQIPLLTGKNTGKNTDSDIIWRVDRHKLQHPCGFFVKIPKKITGNDLEGIREKSLNNREKYIRFTDSMPSRITIGESASGPPKLAPRLDRLEP
jgi:uncharacterized protein YwbE